MPSSATSKDYHVLVSARQGVEGGFVRAARVYLPGQAHHLLVEYALSPPHLNLQCLQ